MLPKVEGTSASFINDPCSSETIKIANFLIELISLELDKA